MPIDGHELQCQYCKNIFLANGDTIAAKYEWFLDDLNILKENKRYGLYILALCQACEIFMNQAIVNKLIDKNPKYRDNQGCFSEEYNKVREEFDKKTCGDISRELNMVCSHKKHKQYKKLTFYNLRDLFLLAFKKDELALGELEHSHNNASFFACQ